MAPRSKELLHLEKKTLSTSSIESALLIHNGKDTTFEKKHPPSDEKPLTSQVPKSQVLGRVKDFLGVLSEANNKLQANAKDNAAKYDIEVLDGNEEIIEMDLMLGVADLHTPEAVAAAESALAGHQPVITLGASTSGTESDTSSNDDDDNNENDDSLIEEKKSKIGKDDLGNTAGTSRSKKQSKKRPKIVELS